MGFQEMFTRLVFAKATVTMIANAAWDSYALSENSLTRYQAALELESLIRITAFRGLLQLYPQNPKLLCPNPHLHLQRISFHSRELATLEN
jgi:hypothetical protein